MAKNIIPETAWTKARTRFIEDLDESEKAGFLDATFENIFYNASAAQKIHQTESFSKKLADKTNVLLSGINAWVSGRLFVRDVPGATPFQWITYVQNEDLQLIDINFS